MTPYCPRAPSTVNEATGPATWSSKGPTWEASPMSNPVSVVAEIPGALQFRPNRLEDGKFQRIDE